MPASQLTQLKAALTTSGLNRKATSKKDNKAFKKGGARETDRAKTLQRLEDIRRGLNRFDERETKVKHNVGGRNLKGVTGRPSDSKQAGLDQRKKSLLPEHQLRGHTGTFKDRRFGESDPSLSLDDRMLERYTRERQRGQGKKGLFNLEGDDEGLDGFDEGAGLGGLTHGGRSVLDLPGDDFETQGLADAEDEEKGTIGRRTVSRGHFGRFEGDRVEGPEDLPGRPKSKAEVMSEIIAKSKDYKYERQQQKEADTDIREELDEDIDDLRALLQHGAPPRGGSSGLPARGASDHDVDYDQVVRSLAFDARSKPKDRTKSEEELAVEEKERLEQAEGKRIRLMRGDMSDEEDDDGPGKRRRKDGKRPDADDLGDDYVDEEDGLLGPGLTREVLENMNLPIGKRKREDNCDPREEGESLEGEETGSITDADRSGDEITEEEAGLNEVNSEQSAMEDLDGETGDDSVAEGDDTQQRVVRAHRRDKPQAPISIKKEVPYTFSCPSSIEEMENILDGLEDSALSIVVQRIRALHHPSLAQGNKEKLQDFLNVVLDYALILADRPPPGFDLISSLVPHIIALVKLNPLTAAKHFTAKISLMQKNLMRGLARGISRVDSRTFPGCPELIWFRLIGVVWSTSDFSHPVVAPAVLLMCQYLGQGRIRGVSDLASGLFLCCVLARYEASSKRLLPEAINFVGSTISLLLPRRKGSTESSPVYPDLQGSDMRFSTSFTHSLAPSEPVSLHTMIEVRESASSDKEVEQVRVNLLAVAFPFIELFSPILAILEGCRVAKLTQPLVDLHSTTTMTISRTLKHSRHTRRPLAMQAHKPIPIASYAPKFEVDFAPGRQYDPDVERNSTAKVKALYKKERKGAIRELRKDNRFLAGEKAREQQIKDSAYTSKMRRVEGDINMERAEEKAMQREKAREKRRAGRK